MASKDVTWDGMDEKKQLLEFYSVQFNLHRIGLDGIVSSVSTTQHKTRQHLLHHRAKEINYRREVLPKCLKTKNMNIFVIYSQTLRNCKW